MREDDEEVVRSCWMTVRKTRGYCKLKQEALDLTLWRTRFGRGCGYVRQTA